MMQRSSVLFAMLEAVQAGTNPVMSGADIVHYFGISKDEPGVIAKDDSHSRKYGGYEFWFSNESNAETFEASPTKYMPLWGGF